MREVIEIKTGSEKVEVKTEAFREAILKAFEKGASLPKGSRCEARVWNHEVEITFTFNNWKENFRNWWHRSVDKLAAKLKGR